MAYAIGEAEKRVGEIAIAICRERDCRNHERRGGVDRLVDARVAGMFPLLARVTRDMENTW